MCNSFHRKLDFTNEKENNNRPPFLDVLFIQNNDEINTAIYKKSTHKNFYLHWNTYMPLRLKRGTLHTLINRPHKISSNKKYLNEELEHLQSGFQMQNGYIMSMMKRIMKEVKTNGTSNQFVPEIFSVTAGK